MSATTDMFWSRSHSDEFRDAWTTKTPSSRSIDQLNEDYRHLEKRIEMLTLVSRALWELLEKKSGIEERDLVAKIAEIDLRDGQLDQQLKRPLLDCPDCGRKVNARTRMCVYCGFKDFPVDVFDQV